MTREIYFVLGGPGSGKGTFCEMVTQRFPKAVSHFSAGDLLRAFLKADEKDITDPERQKDLKIVHECMKEGKIVPAEITTALLFDSILKSPTPYVFIDGFPRNEDNLLTWQKHNLKHPDIHVKGMIFLVCR